MRIMRWVSILGKMLTSNWVSLPVLALAAVGLFLLYEKGKTTEAVVGAAVLAVAVLLMVLGREKKDMGQD